MQRRGSNPQRCIINLSTMDTKLANGVLRPIKDTDVIHKRLEDYVRKDLRDRFDDEKDNVSALHIIDETRVRFEFDDLAKEMIRDFCVDDDCKYLWKLHEYTLE